ncbi:hypothetical protein HMI55_003455 [Coelomomyces lativittatus]|nr:hypothetical protein HMI55_003455 [Coelomomyces lativittatus]
MLLENKSYPIYPGSSILHTSTSTSTSSNHLNKYCAVYCDSSITSAIFESQKNAPSFRITSEEQNPISPLVFDFPSGHHHGEVCYSFPLQLCLSKYILFFLKL